jgi:hypothetical protein
LLIFILFISFSVRKLVEPKEKILSDSYDWTAGLPFESWTLNPAEIVQWKPVVFGWRKSLPL